MPEAAFDIFANVSGQIGISVYILRKILILQFIRKVSDFEQHQKSRSSDD